MIRYNGNKVLFALGIIVIAMISCRTEKKTDPLFEALDSDRTGLDFSNDLSYNKEFNLFKYIYFYNGSGVGAGDFNNDGWIDLFFGSNQHENKLFLNTKSLKFKDVSKQSGIPQDGGWTTGISVVDINNDGLLDIYVSRVGQYEILHSKNQLLINQGVGKDGIPVFKDEAARYGLDFSGFSTQATFFDYDKDGDLDMFLLNHSVHENGTFRPRKDFIGTYHPFSGHRFFRNDGQKFTDVTKETGINSSAIGYGLGVAVSDINLDGYPDMYIGNDFHENDYLYLNQHDGTFKEVGEQEMMHTSQFSMGVDVADINNDAAPEIISVDMLPSDPYILKRSLGEDAYDIFNYKISVGYSHQYTRNNLQYNRQNGLFSEIGLLSGVAATDWSWAPLWMDFDNDGWKDLFISNGIPKRMNDIDYINFVSNSEIQQKIQANQMEDKDMALISKFPEIKLPNRFYRNNRDLTFTDDDPKIEGNAPSFSNGAAYADLDNDGDLDIVVNNIDAKALIYENRFSKSDQNSSIELILTGAPQNSHAVGAMAVLYDGNTVRTYEKYAAKGFMSSMEVPLLLGIANTTIDSLLLIWPDNSYQQIDLKTKKDHQIRINYTKDLPKFDFKRLSQRYTNSTKKLNDITASTGLDFLHIENHFVEFDREPLIPHMISTEGPALAIGDINHDQLEDVYVGASRNGKNAVFLQQPSGKFIRTVQTALNEDSIYEDVDASFVDLNNDNNPDLVVASGGNEFYGKDYHNTPRVYLNDGKGMFSKKDNAFDSLYMTASVVIPNDFNGDGFVDLFIGARAVPYEYGQIPGSYLLQNDGTGRFKDVTNKYAPELGSIGLVTQALWFNIDGDKDLDLLVSLEWGALYAFINDNGKLTKKELTNKKGWWNFILPYDLDNDGDIDLVAGNLGLNSRIKTSAEKPVKMYYNDFDDNGKKEQLLTYYLNGKEIPFANKSELEKQLPVLKKKFLYAADFAKSNLNELIGSQKLKSSELLTADYFANTIFINKGNLQFEAREMPIKAQFSPFKNATIVNANNDDKPDILLFGNYYDNNIQMGRYDADYGTLLINKGNGQFDCQQLNGLQVKGQVKQVRKIRIKNKEALVLARNSDSLMVIQFE